MYCSYCFKGLFVLALFKVWTRDNFGTSICKSFENFLTLKVDLPLLDGPYKWAGGKSISVLDCTVVVIETDQQGIRGYV